MCCEHDVEKSPSFLLKLCDELCGELINRRNTDVVIAYQQGVKTIMAALNRIRIGDMMLRILARRKNIPCN